MEYEQSQEIPICSEPAILHTFSDSTGREYIMEYEQSQEIPICSEPAILHTFSDTERENGKKPSAEITFRTTRNKRSRKKPRSQKKKTKKSQPLLDDSDEKLIVANNAVPDTTVLVYEEIIITKADLKHVQDKESWLSDSIIHFYVTYLQIHEFKNESQMYVVPPHIAQQLKICPDITTFRDWFQDFDISPYELLFFPLTNAGYDTNDSGAEVFNAGQFWILVVYYKATNMFYYQDSHSTRNENYAKFKIEEFFGRVAELLKIPQPYRKNYGNSLTQSNHYDCALYVMSNIRNMMITYSNTKNLNNLPEPTAAMVPSRAEIIDLIWKCGEALEWNGREAPTLLDDSDDSDEWETIPSNEKLIVEKSAKKSTKRKKSKKFTSKSKRKPKLNPFGIGKPLIFVPQKIAVKKKSGKRKQPIPSDTEDDEKSNEKSDENQQPPPVDFKHISMRNKRYGTRMKCRPSQPRHRLKIGLRENEYREPVIFATDITPMPRFKDHKPKIVPVKPKNFGVIRYKSKYDPKTEELFTITMGLHSFLKDPENEKDETKTMLKAQFDDFTVEVTRLSIDASLLLYYKYNKIFAGNPMTQVVEKPDFRGIFASLKGEAKGDNNRNIRKITSDYEKLRQKYKINNGNLYNGHNKTNIVATAADRYETNLKVNVSEHAYDRMKKFFKELAPNIPSYSTLGYLFKTKEDHVPDKKLLQLFHNELKVNSVEHYFKDIFTTQWFKYIPIMYRLQQWRRQRKLKTFRLFPILKNKRHFTSYDGQSLQQFLHNLGLVPSADYNDFRPRENEYWDNYFDLSKVNSTVMVDKEDHGHKFTNHFLTDGVTAYITMKRRKKAEVNEKTFLQDIAGKIKKKEVDELVGLDPGGRLSFAGVRRNLATGKESSLRYSSSSYRFDSGQYRINVKYRHITNPILKRIQKLQEKLPDNASCLADPDIFLIFQLQHLDEKNDVFLQRSLAKLNFERHICKARAIANLAQRIAYGKTLKEMKKLSKKKNKNQAEVIPAVTIFVGSTTISPIIKGYGKSPNKQIVKEMGMLPKVSVINVNEHRTTMLCSRCFQPCTTGVSPHRWQYCSRCRVTWNRDVNAGRNILYVGLAAVNNENPDRRFSYGYKFDYPAKHYQSKSTKLKPHTRRRTIKLRAEHRKTNTI